MSRWRNRSHCQVAGETEKETKSKKKRPANKEERTSGGFCGNRCEAIGATVENPRRTPDGEVLGFSRFRVKICCVYDSVSCVHHSVFYTFLLVYVLPSFI
ncbi:hypothetical protein L1049_028012 [Liquidambar formosana]|uniref:Uncharacterized protein n=1 Tax=Liquidambar formosana TaxID=63359 RepID=A0AAP0RJR4_LIQFO